MQENKEKNENESSKLEQRFTFKFNVLTIVRGSYKTPSCSLGKKAVVGNIAVQ